MFAIQEATKTSKIAILYWRSQAHLLSGQIQGSQTCVVDDGNNDKDDNNKDHHNKDRHNKDYRNKAKQFFFVIAAFL